MSGSVSPVFPGYQKEALDNAPKLNTDPVKWRRENTKTTQKKFLTYRIPVNREEFST